MFIMDDEQSDVGHGCPFSAVTSKHMTYHGGLHLISSVEGVQREVGVSLPLGVVATATMELINK